MDIDTLQRDANEPPGRLRVPVRPDAIARARTEIHAAATAAGVSPDRVDDLVVAISEACTNALEAQLRAGNGTPIEVTHRVDRGVFEVRVRDSGTGFSPSSIPPRPPCGDAHHLDVERGWGIQLMRELVDDLVYDFTGDSTVVCLRLAI